MALTVNPEYSCPGVTLGTIVRILRLPGQRGPMAFPGSRGEVRRPRGRRSPPSSTVPLALYYSILYILPGCSGGLGTLLCRSPLLHWG